MILFFYVWGVVTLFYQKKSIMDYFIYLFNLILQFTKYFSNGWNIKMTCIIRCKMIHVIFLEFSSENF